MVGAVFEMKAVSHGSTRRIDDTSLHDAMQQRKVIVWLMMNGAAVS